MATVTCPDCGKHLIVADPSRQFMFCEYCGAKINLNINVNLSYSKTEHVERVVDEAKVKTANNVGKVIDVVASSIEEQNRRVQEEQERVQAAQHDRKEKIMSGQYSFKEMLVDFMQSRQGKGTLCFAISIVLCLVLLVWGEHDEKIKAHQAELDALEQEKRAAAHLAINQAQIPEFDSTIDARTFVKNVKSQGFVNVTSEAVPDLILGINDKEYEIIEVLVDGAPDYSTDTWYPTDTDIVVRYHTYH